MDYKELYERFYGRYFNAEERATMTANRMRNKQSVNHPSVGLMMTLSGMYHPQTLPLA